MREYLLKTEDGTYQYHNENHDVCPKYVEKIEIPSVDCNCAVIDSKKGVIFSSAKNGIHYLKSLPTFLCVVWQRRTTLEELPFVDDEIHEAEISNFKIGDLHVDLKVNVDVEDPHGLLELGVDKTLAERQSQYGDFKEVASTTQYLLQMLSSDAMSDVQLEALHMICSKLARIAHGDPNHKDSWHDIAGYATLVERSL